MAYRAGDHGSGFVIRVFRTATFGQDLTSDEFREKVAKTPDFCGKRRFIRRVGVDPIESTLAVIVCGGSGVVWGLGHWMCWVLGVERK